MNFKDLSTRLRPGVVIGRGARSYEVERINEENTYLRGNPEARRQDQAASMGSLRIIPTRVIIDIITAVEGGAIDIGEIARNRTKGESQGSSAFNRLNLDYDPYLLGYDSTIRSICEFMLSGTPQSVVFPTRYSSFLPKPFLLLAGISGTGKTRWVRQREEAELGNVEVIPVRPDWHEPSDLLGFVSRVSGSPVFVPTDFLRFLLRAWRHAWSLESRLDVRADSLERMRPFWLCLDEMNLAPVEQYFADYLSVLEERSWDGNRYDCPPILRLNGEAEAIKHALGVGAVDDLWSAFVEKGGIPLPPNLVVVGTVNMDETTHAFSRKVLDRALTVEFDEVDFAVFRDADGGGDGRSSLPWTTLSSVTDARDLDIAEETSAAVLALLESWNQILDQTAFRVAYRTINESLLVAASLADRPIEEALDWIAMTKLLPRLEGDEDRLGCDREDVEVSYLDTLDEDWRGRFAAGWEKSRSRRKLDFMRLRLRRSGYCSYWP